MGKYSHIITILGITWENIPILFTILGIAWGHIPMLFTILGFKRKLSLFPRKKLPTRHWETANSQNYPKKGISCPRFFPIMGKFPI